MQGLALGQCHSHFMLRQVLVSKRDLYWTVLSESFLSWQENILEILENSPFDPIVSNALTRESSHGMLYAEWCIIPQSQLRH